MDHAKIHCIPIPIISTNLEFFSLFFIFLFFFFVFFTKSPNVLPFTHSYVHEARTQRLLTPSWLAVTTHKVNLNNSHVLHRLFLILAAGQKAGKELSRPGDLTQRVAAAWRQQCIEWTQWKTWGKQKKKKNFFTLHWKVF